MRHGTLGLASLRDAGAFHGCDASGRGVSLNRLATSCDGYAIGPDVLSLTVGVELGRVGGW